MPEIPKLKIPPKPPERPLETHRPIEIRPEISEEIRRIQVQEAVKATARTINRNVFRPIIAVLAEVTLRQWVAVLMRLFGLIGLFVVYQTIEAEGLREIFGDVVGKRLSKASSLFLGWMANFEETRKLDMANALAAAFLLFTYMSWEAVISRLVHRPEGESLVERYLMVVPAVVLMVIDTILFGAGVYANGSFSSPIPAAMLALGYDAMLILFSFWVVKIERSET